jgi:hypothetical protein
MLEIAPHRIPTQSATAPYLKRRFLCLTQKVFRLYNAAQVSGVYHGIIPAPYIEQPLVPDFSQL